MVKVNEKIERKFLNRIWNCLDLIGFAVRVNYWNGDKENKNDGHVHQHRFLLVVDQLCFSRFSCC